MLLLSRYHSNVEVVVVVVEVAVVDCKGIAHVDIAGEVVVGVEGAKEDNFVSTVVVVGSSVLP